MQSVVTGQASITLEWKIISGGKQIKTEDSTHSKRLIIMRMRFRASDFGLVAKTNIIRAKSKQASCAEMVLGSFLFLLV